MFIIQKHSLQNEGHSRVYIENIWEQLQMATYARKTSCGAFLKQNLVIDLENH